MKKFLLKSVLLSLLTMTFIAAPTAYAQQQRAAAANAPEKFIRTAGRSREQVDFLSFVRTELFFGRNKPDGTEVTEEEFADFLSVTITPQFPDGLTVLDGIGQFRGADGKVIREKTKILILLYPHNEAGVSSRKIERIRRAYKARFDQQSVLRVDDFLPSRVSF